MDATRFDELLRSLASSASRRGVLAGLAGGLFGVAPFALGDEDALGKGEPKHKNENRKRRKKKRKKQQPPVAECASFCTGECLSNGSCATICVNGGCAAGCDCSDPSTEGPQHCIPDELEDCEQVPQVCTSTADCPRGQHCQEAPCGPGGAIEFRCVPLCNA